MAWRRLLVVVVAVAWSSGALAQEYAARSDLRSFQVHGFVSQGFLVTTDNNYLARSTKGSFEFTEVGLNVTKPLTDKLRVGMQLFARDLGPIGNYSAKFDWFYIDYRFTDWFGIRAGRVKVPFGLYNEINDADSARAFVLLPQSLYPVTSRDFLLAQTGGEMYGRAAIPRAGALEYRVYAGTVFLENTPQPGQPYEISDIHVPYLVGGRAMWETPLDGLRAGGSVQWLRLTTDYLADSQVVMPLQMQGLLPADFNGKGSATIPARLWVASIEYAAHDLLLAAEYSRWHLDLESSVPALIPEMNLVNERSYAMAAYRVNHWLQPGAYYSLLYNDVHDRNGADGHKRDAFTRDAAATLRFDLNAYWLLKLEGHYMVGTAILNSRLNGGTPLNQLEREWWLFMIKTTAYY
jgi:hypothetical protein